MHVAAWAAVSSIVSAWLEVHPEATGDQVVDLTRRTLELLDVPAGLVPRTRFVGRTLADVERELIMATLASVAGNRGQAATILGIGDRTIYRKLAEYGMTTAGEEPCD